MADNHGLSEWNSTPQADNQGLSVMEKLMEFNSSSWQSRAQCIGGTDEKPISQIADNQGLSDLILYFSKNTDNQGLSEVQFVFAKLTIMGSV